MHSLSKENFESEEVNRILLLTTKGTDTTFCPEIPEIVSVDTLKILFTWSSLRSTRMSSQAFISTLAVPDK